MKTQTLYKVSVTFQGTAVIQMEAETPEAARIVASELTLPDLARQGQTDVHSLKIAAREITAVSALSGEADEPGETSPRKPRPSGWYRPA